MNFREGYLRTSCSEYSTDKQTLNNDYIHLTNNAVQKNAPGYGTYEDGNQLSYKDFRKYLRDKRCKIDFDKDMIPKMKSQIAHSLLSVSNFNNFKCLNIGKEED